MLRRYLFTRIGAAFGVVALGAWTFTFEPHGGVDLSWALFPLARAAAGLWADWAVPVPVWYGSMLLHWPVIGAAVDLVRWMLQRRPRVELRPEADGLAIRQYDIVRVVRLDEERFRERDPWGDRHPLVGDVGTVVEIHTDPPGFEVEGFVDGCLQPLWIECFEPDELERINRGHDYGSVGESS